MRRVFWLAGVGLCGMMAACHGGTSPDKATQASPSATSGAAQGATASPPRQQASAANGGASAHGTVGATANDGGGTSVAAASAGGARKVSVKTKLYTFSYAYPAAAGAIPALRQWLDADLARQQAVVAKDAREAAREAAPGSDTFFPYDRSVDWQVVTDLPGWLSLSTMDGDYSGGAHPNYGYSALLWDKGAGQRRKALDLFVSRAAFSAAIRKPFCAALNHQRGKRRGQVVDPHSTDMFDACIDPAASTVILGSASHKGFDRIGVLIAPYEAGPYAEGSYEVTLPVTPAVRAVVKPAWRGAFVAGG